MAMICRVAAICRMISPICPAIAPLTPVSISSKMMVGSPLEDAINDLIHSMIRLISPPDAISLTGRRLWLRFAAKRNCTLSRPVSV